jgi:hypothetical protein
VAVEYGEECLVRCVAVLAVRLVLLYSVRALGCVSLPVSFPFRCIRAQLLPASCLVLLYVCSTFPPLCSAASID